MRQTVSGFVALAAATFAVQVIGFFVLAVIARRLGDGGLGAYSFALNLAAYFAIPANFGVTALATREVAREPERATEIAGQVLALQTVLGLLPYAVLVLLAGALSPDDATAAIIPIVGATFLLEAWSAAWALYATQRFVAAALTRLAGSVVFAVLVLALLREGDGATELAWLHLAGVAMTSVLSVLVVLRALGRLPLRGPVAALRGRFRSGLALGVSAVMIMVYYTADSLMLGWLEDVETVGQYAVAYKLPLAVLAFAALWGQVLLPHFSALAERSRIELREQTGFFASISLVGTLPLIAGALVVGPDLVPELFGEEFEPAGTPFVLLMAAAALVLFTVNYGTAAIAVGDERHYAVAVTLGATLNIAANLVVIPLFGMTGAACATIGAEVVVFAYVYARLRRLVGEMPLEQTRIARASAATAAMIVVLVVLPSSLAPSVQVGIGLVVFLLVSLPLRVVHVDELRRLVPR